MTGKQLKNSILQWAIQGKLVPQDPNDEPASVLLEKIRAEKARLVKEGKIKKDKKESIIYRGDDNSYYEKFADGTTVCIDDEIPFDVPKGWEWCRMRNISINIEAGKSIQCHEYVPSLNEIGIVKTGVATYGYFKEDESKTCMSLSDWHDEYAIHKGDFLIVRANTEKLVGACVIVENIKRKLMLSDKVLRVNYHQYVHSFYILNVMRTFSLREQIEAVASGTSPTMKNISQEAIKNLIIPLPPLAEQHRIVEKIQKLLPIVEQYDSAQSKLDSLNANINELLKKSILQEAIQGKLVPQDPNDEPASSLLEKIKAEKARLVLEGKLKKKDVIDSTIFRCDDNKYYEQIGGEVVDITEDIPFDAPEGWPWCRLKSICTIFTGATFKKEDAKTDKQGIRILRGGNILPFEITFKADDIFLPCNFVKENILLQKNDIVTPAVTSLENIGKMARVKDDLPDVTVGGFVFVLRLYYSNDWLSQYLLALMSSPTIIEYMKSITNKSGQAFYNIGKERLATTLLPIPPLAEQQRIVNKIEKIFNEIKSN